jgi:hypothetical protein
MPLKELWTEAVELTDNADFLPVNKVLAGVLLLVALLYP